MQRLWSVLMTVLLIIGFASTVSAAEIQLMTTEQLKSSMNDTSVVILDARGSWDWVKTDDKIAGSIRVDPGKVDRWADGYDKGKTIVLYCA